MHEFLISINGFIAQMHQKTIYTIKLNIVSCSLFYANLVTIHTRISHKRYLHYLDPSSSQIL